MIVEFALFCCIRSGLLQGLDWQRVGLRWGTDSCETLCAAYVVVDMCCCLSGVCSVGLWVPLVLCIVAVPASPPVLLIVVIFSVFSCW